MPDDLIDKLASQIKAKEDAAALTAKIQLHKADFIRANCGAFFGRVADELKRLTDELTAALAGNSSADPPIVFSRQAISVAIDKHDFPNAHAELNVNAQALNLKFELYWSPRRGGPGGGRSNGTWKFDVNQDNDLILLNNPGEPAARFTTPKEVAEFVISTIFTVA